MRRPSHLVGLLRTAIAFGSLAMLAPNAARAQPRADWHLLDPATDGIPGAAVRRAVKELLAGQTPRRQVIVAVIDDGIDSAHAGVRPLLWRNAREIAGNRRDDDGNGYVDDGWGWNFLGAGDGRNIDYVPLEITRLAARCRAGDPPPARPPAGAPCDTLVREYTAAREAAVAALARYDVRIAQVDTARTRLARALGVPREALTRARVAALPADTTDSAGIGRARAAFLAMPPDVADIDRELRTVRQSLALRLDPGFDRDIDQRAALLGDTRRTGRRYGNGDATTSIAGHGTVVASAVASVVAGALNDSGIVAKTPNDGAAPFVRILAVRAVIPGDEYDADVANAIRYAVDRGARILNLSFGKRYSPEKPAVDSAVRYAMARGALVVHSAMNEAADLDAPNTFAPRAEYAGGGRAAAWLEVGASGPAIDARLAARFSNYGRTQVDIFAPGVDVLAAAEGGSYRRRSGTSLAAPVVSGVAALLMAYFPTLSAADVRRILLATVTPYRDVMVTRPGTDRQVPFGTLSATGGIVNAYEAVRMAQRETRTRAPR